VGFAPGDKQLISRRLKDALVADLVMEDLSEDGARHPLNPPGDNEGEAPETGPASVFRLSDDRYSVVVDPRPSLTPCAP